MRILLMVCLLSHLMTLRAQELNIIPRPVEQRLMPGQYALKTKMTVSNTLPGTDWKKIFPYLKTEMYRQFGISLTEMPAGKKGDIDFFLKRMPTSGKPAYTLEVGKDGISINANFDVSAFYAIQTLFQLMPPESGAKKEIPFVYIFDHARFEYRGMHLDCGRHFWPVDFIKRYIDYLALHKINTFHWHLTEDQGWRIEIKKYPQLTSVGAWRNGTIIGRFPGKGNDGIHYGGFYTQAQVRDIVKYAEERFIDVIPEIEMPGHCSAAIAAYPWLSCFPDEPTISYFPKQCSWHGDSTGKQVQQTWGVFDDVFCAGQDKTFGFLEDVLDEVMELFPSKYIHIGGDECPKANWKRCPKCQQRMKENGLKDEHELQSYFIQRMEKYLNNKGRSLIGWDEILEGGLAPNAIVMSWRGEKGGIEAAKQKHKVIMTPGNPVYFDHSQSENEDSVTIGGYNPIEKVYAWDPVPAELTMDESPFILGAQANVWTEYMKNTQKVEYMIFPRMAALSELLWSARENKDWRDFERRLMVQLKRYDRLGLNYSRAYFELKTNIAPNPGGKGLLWQYSSKFPDVNYRISSRQIAVQADTVPVYSIDDPTHVVRYQVYKPGDTVQTDQIIAPDTGAYLIRETGQYQLSAYHPRERDGHRIPESKPFTTISQSFHFNKATGKKISLEKNAARNYPGDGAFTLVNGVINEKGMARSREFLGFSGDDCVATIDLGDLQEISFVVVNYLNQTASWIWAPSSAELFGSSDGQSWFPLKSTEDHNEKPTGNGKGYMSLAFRKSFTRYVKLVVRNKGLIPPGYPGAGNKAWLFVDEIEVE